MILVASSWLAETIRSEHVVGIGVAREDAFEIQDGEAAVATHLDGELGPTTPSMAAAMIGRGSGARRAPRRRRLRWG